MKIVLEPVFEADFLPCSFGFRPKRAAHDGLQVLLDESFRGDLWVAETDVADCFGAIPHSGLMSAVEERISDRRLLALLRAFLRAGVMEHGSVRRPVTGTAQGGVISPLMCNVYLHRLDRAWRGAYGTLVGYADDALVMCRSKGQAVAALARLTALLADLGLEPKAAKTRIVHLTVGGEGVDFLGFHHRLVRSRATRGTGTVMSFGSGQWGGADLMAYSLVGPSGLRPVAIEVARPDHDSGEVSAVGESAAEARVDATCTSTPSVRKTLAASRRTDGYLGMSVWVITQMAAGTEPSRTGMRSALACAMGRRPRA